MLRKLSVLVAGLSFLLGGLNLILAVLKIQESTYPKKLKVKIKLK
ncbi:hypothetical protein RA086_11265 [Lactiplantibacillus sp. WILCCON 0030]|uniref:Uncharacterized protein n=1 Tax=Lactiplantibacillus brownii TaxID=3069269 RepID=A0ABU1AB55_9LACO|nr:hypothetical protein [Lactiplantibacillus brownii]MDQ7938187.1 hypothetical protein [Lactiplantibacillus brownii]